MKNTDHYDSYDYRCRDSGTSDSESDNGRDDSNSVSSAYQGSSDGDGDGDGDSHGEKFVEFDAVVGDRTVKINALTADEIRAMEFGTVDEANVFYFKYAKCKGFAIRKSDVRTRSTEDGQTIIMRQFVCNKHGLRDTKHLRRLDRKREHRPTTRTNCPARLRVHYNPQKDIYVVTCFEEAHNHELTPSRFVHLHPIYREITAADRAQIDGLQSNGIRTCHIMGYMVAQKGGHDRVGFTKKDLYNYFDSKMRANIKDGDVAAAINYLTVKSSTDPMLYGKYAVDMDGRMKSLFWADGSSRSDYFCFGDVIAFDTTYKKNKYNYPLVIFSGCNHHSQTVIFGAALVSDETTETYKWLLECFLECMENRYPAAVVTDGDGAMRESIKQVFPDATHRLCAWHLNKNASENVKNSAFLKDFQKAMYSNFTKDQFEEFWSKIIKENGLEGNPWVAKTYENRSLWATAYLREKFFGRIRTTSQCEAVNAVIKSYVRKKGCIFEFMHNFDQAMRSYRNNELIADYKSKFSEPVMTTQLRALESHAANVYTMEIFKEVRDEIVKAGSLIVKEKLIRNGFKTYRFTKYCCDNYDVEVVYDGETLQCECRLWDSHGIPCSHMFGVMKEEHVSLIPTGLILSRWTKDAKIQYLNVNCNGSDDSKMIELARFGAYCSAFTAFCNEASKREGVYGEIMGDILKLHKKYCSTDDPILASNSVVGDPNIVNSKGAPKKRKNDIKSIRRCSKCNSRTHNARSCSVAENAPTEQNVGMTSRPVTDSFSQVVKNKNGKRGRIGGSSVQNKCTEPPNSRGANVTATSRAEVGSTSIPMPAMYGLQPVLPAVQPMLHPMHVQPLIPLYPTTVAENSGSCFGRPQRLMNNGGT
ncbi:protein FAR1-RELATED SEQUENCE 5-like [Vicia villosa]|uniref:protein FAR1-RELATED SEQUENCE 5-like n=1 Tax=Vicia villosa TaxID=3911 RepID=UPI00273AEDD8|nr:protein FAR1-RELATED SEQUENCE 5-like [Vicia villosa]